jgi:hypothetical protein
MPRLSSFYGITIAMFWREQNHPVAHFHAEYGEHAASFAVDGRLLAGSLPPRALRLVREWPRCTRTSSSPTGSSPQPGAAGGDRALS